METPDRMESVDIITPPTSPVSNEVSNKVSNEVSNKVSNEVNTELQTNMSLCLKQLSECIASIKNKLGDQDFQQRSGVTVTVLLELYRVLIASFLILFVPQSCGDHVCTISENAQTGSDPLYNAGFSFNCITLAAFVTMYFAEVKREGKLIAYLDVNSKCMTDNDSVGLVLERLPIERKNTILFYDKFYQKSGYFALVCFIVNTILSGFVVNKYYLDDKTTSTFITSVLFMITKMGDVYSTVSTDRNIFYSAYLKGKIQYNDLDSNKDLPKVDDKVIDKA